MKQAWKEYRPQIILTAVTGLGFGLAWLAAMAAELLFHIPVDTQAVPAAFGLAGFVGSILYLAAGD